jgi:Xaa-Pro aminopeptidase
VVVEKNKLRGGIMSTVNSFISRRGQLLKKSGNQPWVLKAGGHRVRNGDVLYKYRVDSNFFWATGLEIPDAVLVLDAEKRVLYVPEGLSKHERDCIGSDLEVRLLENLEADVEAITDGKRVYGTEWLDFVWNAIQEPKKATRILAELRAVKSEWEIELIRRAAKISMQAHSFLSDWVKPGTSEMEIQAELSCYLAKSGVTETAYPSIVAAQDAGLEIHYQGRGTEALNNGLILVDAGAEVDLYASDITRTMPVNGKFSETEKVIYDLVLQSQQKAIDMVKPGVKLLDIDKVARENLYDGLIRLNVLPSNTDELAKSFPHSTAHLIGLDVHDPSPSENLLDLELKPNMVLAIEPAVYLSPELKGLNRDYEGLAVRIEDMVLVTEDGVEVITEELPK